ncbi:hypothetical protein DFH27DRAFT_529103 [Peziza echinospora]|nr:hypothetical protein DFH27DRAFT_529103 [Peziza echinospora]
MSIQNLPTWAKAIIILVGVLLFAALLAVGRFLISRHRLKRHSLHSDPPTTPGTLRGKFSSFSFSSSPPSVHLATDYYTTTDPEKGGNHKSVATTAFRERSPHTTTTTTASPDVEDTSLWGTLRECRYLPMTHRERARVMGAGGRLPPPVPERRGRSTVPRPLPEVPTAFRWRPGTPSAVPALANTPPPPPVPRALPSLPVGGFGGSGEWGGRGSDDLGDGEGEKQDRRLFSEEESDQETFPPWPPTAFAGGGRARCGSGSGDVDRGPSPSTQSPPPSSSPLTPPERVHLPASRSDSSSSAFSEYSRR